MTIKEIQNNIVEEFSMFDDWMDRYAMLIEMGKECPIIDKMGVAVRTGHHCAEPVMTFFGIPGTVRASFAMYNTKEEIDIFVKAVERAANMLR